MDTESFPAAERSGDPLEIYYSGRNEDERLGSKHGQVEFLTTMRYINRYINPGSKVVEIGAGSGRYSRAIAESGYDVEAVELFEHNISVFRKLTKPGCVINIRQGNALDLSALPDNEFDITLLLGPMYHLFTEDDKRRALSEALRVTKTGGLLFVAYCISDGSIIQSGFLNKLFDVGDYIKRGKIDPVTFGTFSLPEDIFELVRKEDADRLIDGFNVERLHYVATDLFTRYIRDAVNSMSDEEFSLYLRYHFAVCERADMAGISHHTLDILRKT
jgi:SAM-dependent methyltransferase